MKLVGTTTGFVAFQSLVAVAAWGFLAFTVGRLVRPGWPRVVAVWVVLGFATSTPVVLWNRSVLSESLSLSLLAVLMATTIGRRPGTALVPGGGARAAGLAFATTRDAQVWTVALLGVAIGLVALATVIRERRFPRRVGALAGALSWWRPACRVGGGPHRTDPRERGRRPLRPDPPLPARVAWFAHHGMPGGGGHRPLHGHHRPTEPGGGQGLQHRRPGVRPPPGRARAVDRGPWAVHLSAGGSSPIRPT